MIEFLYTGDYSCCVQEIQETADGEPSEQEEYLLPHVYMNAIADYYDIKALVTLSKEKLQAAASSSQSPDGTALLDAAAEALRRTGDTALHDTLAEATAGKLRQYLDAERLVKLVNPFGVAVLKHVVAREDKLHAAMASLSHERDTQQIRLRTAEARAERIVANIKSCLALLCATGGCRNETCQAKFDCYIERRGKPNEPVLSLRCARCQCRHRDEMA